MKKDITIGQSFTKEILVDKNQTAVKYGSGLLEVFATPAMIGLMENSASSCIQENLDDGYITLGIEISVKHLKATPIGMTVKAEAEVIKIEDKKISFKVKAWDQDGLIGEGTHDRFIVNSVKFMQKFNR